MRVRRRLIAFLFIAALAGCGGSSRGGSFASIAPATSASAPIASSSTPSTITTSTATLGPVTGAPATTTPANPGTPGSGPATPPSTTTTTATPSGPSAPAATSAPFNRIVLCLDGLPHRVMKDLQARGRFKDFHPASRMVAPFPSLSNISWASLMDIGPEAGYQAVYFSNELNHGVGITTQEMSGSRFERRMHHRIDGIVSHGLDYLAPFLAGKHNLLKMVKGLIDHKGSKTAFAYALETDSCAHMRGREDLEKMLEALDDELVALSKEYKTKFGGELEIAIVSDHGHTLQKGQMVEIEKTLKAAGYNPSDQIKGPKDVAFKLAGILSSLAIHCQPQAVPDLARVLAKMDGADLAVYRESPDTFRVVALSGEGVIKWDKSQESYAYQVASGRDPIGYAAVYGALAAQGKVDQRGFAKARDLFEATPDHAYPDAPARIRRGLTDLVHSPAAILVSLQPGHESASGLVKKAAGIIGRNGTHGALAQNDSAGVFLTNFMPTPAAIEGPDFKKQIDLSDYKANAPSMEVSVEPTFDASGKRIGGELACHLRDDGAAAANAKGLTTKVRARIERVRFLLKDVLVVGPVEADEKTLKKDGPQFILEVPGAPAKLEEGKKYDVIVDIERHDAAGRVVSKEERKVKFTFDGTFQDVD